MLQGSNLRPTACKAVALPTELNTPALEEKHCTDNHMQVNAVFQFLYRLFSVSGSFLLRHVLRVYVDRVSGHKVALIAGITGQDGSL